MSSHPSETTLPALLSSQYAPVQAEILNHLGPGEISSLARVSNQFSEVKTTLGSKDFNINLKLKKFFSDPPAFRSVQAECGVLIGGLFAQRFFERDAELPDTLELYMCTRCCGFSIFFTECLLSDGYEPVYEENGSHHEVHEARGFFKRAPNGNLLQIRFKAQSKPAVLELLKAARTTATMNFIAWNKAYALFPHETFVMKKCYMLSALNDSVGDELAALSKLGYKTGSIHWNQRHQEGAGSKSCVLPGDSEALTRLRRVGDKHTWVLNLDADTEGVIVPDTPTAVLESTTFNLLLDLHDYWLIPHYRLGALWSLYHPVLKYTYVTAVNGDYGLRVPTPAYFKRISTLIERLDDLTLIELTKIPKNDRPPEYRTLPISAERSKALYGKFNFDTWTFYDDEVLEFLADAWAKHQAEEAEAPASKKKSKKKASM